MKKLFLIASLLICSNGWAAYTTEDDFKPPIPKELEKDYRSAIDIFNESLDSFDQELKKISSPMNKPTHLLQVAYILPKGETAKPRADEVIKKIISILQKHYYEQLGVTFELKEPLITVVRSPLRPINAIEWNNNAELIRRKLNRDYVINQNVVVSILEGTNGEAGGAWNIVKMTGGFWNTAYETYMNDPDQLPNKLAAWSHELGHAFGLLHTAEFTVACLAKHGINVGPLPSLLMQMTTELGSVFNYPFLEEEKSLLLNPDYYPDCRPVLSPPDLIKPHASKHLSLTYLPNN